jgi:hypothetical protein
LAIIPPLNFQRPPSDFHQYLAPSPFPPSFDGNPWAYGFGLFGDVVAAALSLCLLLTYVFEARRSRQIGRILPGSVFTGAPLPLWSPLFIFRATNICLLTFVVMRTLPDALWMLAWGEVSDGSIRFLLALDLWADGLALGPFLAATMFWAWGRQTIPQKLIAGPQAEGKPKRGKLPWDIIVRNGRIVLVVLIIAIGVTVGKASG